MQPGFHDLPFDLVDRCDACHCPDRSALPQRPASRRVRSRIACKLSQRGGLTRDLYNELVARRWRFWKALETDDCLIIATLLLAVATAILTAPRDATAAWQKFQFLLLTQGAAELISTGGAVGRQFPVSP